MENTLENKAKFFALYWGQRILFEGSSLVNEFSIVEFLADSYLELTPLSQITDEDLKAIGFTFPDGIKKIDFTFCFDNYQFHWKAIKDGWQSKEGYLTLKDFDYLRSKGYALPWMGLSVEQLVSFGWVKLKEG